MNEVSAELNSKTFSFEIVSIKDVAQDIYDMLSEHNAEVGFFDEINPNFKSYELLEHLGQYKLFALRSGANLEIVGYAGYYLRPHMHNKNNIMAVMDAIYIRPEFRGLGKQLINFCDAELKKFGANAVMACVSEKHDWSSTLVRFGYELVEKYYARKLD